LIGRPEDPYIRESRRLSREELDMRSFLISCVAAVVIALGGVLVLNHFQKPVETAFSSPTGVRI
jgi:hypothetical protein